MNNGVNSRQVRQPQWKCMSGNLSLIKLIWIQVLQEIDSFVDVHMSKHAKRLDCLLPDHSVQRPKTRKDWYSLVDPAQNSQTFDSNIKKLCYAFEHNLQSDILWNSFIGYALMCHSLLIDKGTKLLEKTPECEKYDNIEALFHDKLCRRRKTVREGCKQNFEMHVSSVRDAGGERK